MLQCIKRWFYGVDLNDCNIEVKIKYTNLRHQEGRYRNIAGFDVKAYWRIEGMWLWRFAGFIQTSNYNGLVSEVNEPQATAYLREATNLVQKYLRDGESIAKLQTRFHVSELNQLKSERR